MRETGILPQRSLLSQQALAHLPEQDTLLRAMVTLNLTIAHYLLGEFEPASQLLTEIIATGQTDQLMANTLSAIYLNTQILRAQGSFATSIAALPGRIGVWLPCAAGTISPRLAF